MTNDQKRYLLLFNAITDAIRQIDEQNFGSARETLVLAQQQAEALYIEEPE